MVSTNHTAVIGCEPRTVWHLLRQFGAIHNWHPEVAQCVIATGEATGTGGSIRTLHLVSGEVISERLCAIDNRQMTMTYELTGSDIAAGDFVASLRVSHVGPGLQTLLEWTAHITTADKRAQSRSESLIGEFILSDMDGLAEHLGASIRLDIEIVPRPLLIP